jgi:predicted permease
VNTLFQDLRYAFRMLIKSPGFTAVVVLTLALGIGANTAIFSVINGVLLHPLPYPHSERLVELHETSTTWGKDGWGSSSGPDFDDWRAQNHSFSGLAACFEDGLNLVGGSEPQRIRSLTISADFFSILGADAARGRLLDAADFKAGAPRVLVLSYPLWQRVFGADPSIIGKNLELSGQVYTVVGVTSRDFVPLGNEQLWTPLAPGNPTLQDRGSHWLSVIGRLKPDASLASASSDLDVIAARLRKQYPDTNSTRGVRADSLEELRVQNIRPALLILLAAVGFVLLIACVNVANLLLARATTRRKEISVRLAIGASRSRLIRQLLTESITVSIIGGALGLALAWAGTPALLSLAPQNMLESAGPIHIGLRVLLFTGALSLLAGVLFGLVPALQSGRVDLNTVLKDSGSRSGSAAEGARVKSSLIVFEIAAAMLLLTGGGLMLRSFASLLRVAPGIDPHNVLTMQLYMPATTTAQVPARLASFRDMLHRIQNLPGILSASSIVYLPFSGNNINGDFAIAGRPAAKPEDGQEAEMRIVNARYLSTMRVPILRGRDLNEQDDASGAAVAVINRTLAERYFPHQDAIGQSVSLWDGPNHWLRIVGVAGDTHEFGFNEPPRPSVYFCMSAMKPDDLSQFMPLEPLSFVIRTSSSPDASAKPVIAAIHSIDPEMPVSEVQSMETLISQSLAQPRLASVLLGIFAALALVLAAIGLYGVMAYVVTQRTHEIGIRMALGAKPANVLKMVLQQGLTLTLIGLALGVVGAFALTRLMSSLLFGVAATDPLTFIIVALILLTVSTVACCIPARRAMRVDPMIALRYE